ncbi:bacteriohopanetetrol glucosamine biosynthesis glycosyltransferase HpnI [Acetobacteraceae bacterium ESL0709]|nr:bacteriohopanetetrol glucosamine biosynthesis glycosyltransferase HpnI [Acetobacteraceae bacterium ESL0697]MDF7677358.1 bacteriohopanetetrol glucosamine biosynthesis glycosyltransferase HpnI [Acetobacteraceae bacterium ESL0709]
MSSIFPLLSGLSCALSLIGQAQSVLGCALLARFVRHAGTSCTPDMTNECTIPTEARWPSVSVLKPLSGNEPLLEEALDSFFRLDYPSYELVFGLHSASDAALSTVERLCARYPQQRTSIVIDTAEHGPNRKVGNLINIEKKCHYDIYVISDSDIHVEPDYLKQIVLTLQKPGVSLVTTLYAGLAADSRLVRQMGAVAINSNFLPGVVLSRLLGREDCLGATMVLTRHKLKTIGGFKALVGHIADDAILGQLIRDRGEKVAIAPTICRTTVTEENFGELFSHELRWGRTVRSVEPLGYGLSSVQLPLFWASLGVIFSPTSLAPWLTLGLGWILKALVVRKISRLTKCPNRGIFPFLILRDWFSAVIMIASATGSRVAWRGQTVLITSARSQSDKTGGVSVSDTPPLSAQNSPIESPSINRSARS